jgi:hypothetical protein
MAPEQVQGFADMLDALAENDFAELPLEVRTQILHDVAASSHEARLGVLGLRNMTLLFFYALPDEQPDDGRAAQSGEPGGRAGGRRPQNPNWEAICYPGPISAPPSPEQAPKTIRTTEVSGEVASLTADVCVVGSGPVRRRSARDSHPSCRGALLAARPRR